MNSYLRVLIVEDSEDDTLLTVRELRRGGYTLDYVRVDTPTAMQAVLEQQTWDIVIADYTLPAFNAPEALKILQSRKLDLPFIIVSGTIGEDIAVAAMKAGAHDYLIKGNLTRLVPAVERELREAQERHQRYITEQALQESEERFRQLAENITEMVFWMADPKKRQILYVSPAYSSIWGYTDKSLYANMKWLEAIHTQDRQRIQSIFFEQSLAGTYDEEYRIIRPDGSLRWIRDRGFPMRDKFGEPHRVVGIAEDITERKLAEQQIREQAALLDIAIDAIFVQDLHQQLLFWNKGAEHLYGWEAAEILGKKTVELLYRQTTLPEFEAIQSILAQKGKWQGELQQVTKDGQDIIVESRWTLVRDEAGNPKSILTVSTDITEKKQLQAQFLQSQRLESIGTLASGIAHDFNNILTPILAVAQLLPIKIPNLDEKSHQLLEILESSAKRGADLVKQILSFTRRGKEGTCTTIQARHLLADVAQIALRTFPKSIETRTDVAPELWTIVADATQLHQVLMNLIINARDAMPHGGILRISAENFWMDESYARMNVNAKVGPYIVITISDTGTGIAPEIIDRIFDPFFTTKEIGKGTGLGLSTVVGIVKNHSGLVNVYSEIGKGSTFKVYLPSNQVAEPQAQVDTELPNGNGELILVIDDEVSICEITKTTLESHNYRVVSVTSGIEALAFYAQYKDDISLVLIDLMMPEMDGSTTILTLQRINPQVQIIAMSGLMPNWTNFHNRNLSIQEFLLKPFTNQALLNALQKVLHPVLK